ncbi:MAG TPA: CapA family protein, partial [Candidatus Saccharibacteria bacterium]|nr:CapA family protein [Candidatus Saccharibacteria bacterium]
QHVRPLYSDADVVFCNQEGPSAGPGYGISGYPSFNAPTELSSDLQEGAGCNLISLANNHLGDKGVGATNATIDNWDKLSPLAVAGANKTAADQQKVAYTEVKGIKISFLAFADFNNNRVTPSYSVNIYHDTTLFEGLLKEARRNSDVVIVSMHWGTEDSPAINADQRRQVATLASLGADIVIGTGPHVLQPVEVIKRPDGKDMVVWYSIGNMLSSQLRTPQLFSGIATLDIVKHPDTNEITVENLGFIPTYMHYEWTAAEEANSQLLARKNPMLYPLSEATQALARSNHRTTTEEQRNYIISIFGNQVTVE